MSPFLYNASSLYSSRSSLPDLVGMVPTYKSRNSIRQRTSATLAHYTLHSQMANVHDTPPQAFN